LLQIHDDLPELRIAAGVAINPAYLVPTSILLSPLAANVLPLAIPDLISAGIFAFMLLWSECIHALTFVSSSEVKTVPAGVVTELVEGDAYDWGVADGRSPAGHAAGCFRLSLIRLSLLRRA